MIPGVVLCEHSAGPYDEIRFVGSGTTDGGRFRCAIDTLLIANAPCGPIPTMCAANVVGGCPCGNQPTGGPPSGCTHSFGQGGKLTAAGTISITADGVVLGFIGLPASSTGVLAQSSGMTAGAPFGDGLLCLAPPRMRVLSLAVNGSGSSSYPLPGEMPLSVRAGLTTPGTRHYQFVYRNAAAFCTPSTYNVTNGVTIAWGP
jgi:hypothetical protein